MNKKNMPAEDDPREAGSPSQDAPPIKAKPSLLDTLNTEGGTVSVPQPEEKTQQAAVSSRVFNWGRLVSAAAWVVALGAVVFAAYLWQTRPASAASVPVMPTPRPTATPEPATSEPVIVDLPEMPERDGSSSLPRWAEVRTIIPSRPRSETVRYTVDIGDAIFSIADQFNVKPETILWANYDLLNDNPDFLEVGMELNVPPVDGVLYEWVEGDTLDAVASTFEADVSDILEFTANQIDLSDPDVPPGELVMIPGGEREFRQWLIPTINRGNAGVSSLALGPGACSGSFTGPVGSGAFIWPTGNHTLSGNDYWSGHLAIDIGEVPGNPIYASDAGVVVFTGWANGGYGYTIVVDHGNGYQTLYAHMSAVYLPCGAGVGAGTVMGGAGSTGNSTGTHLHFEVRLNGGFINPWFVLPPP